MLEMLSTPMNPEPNMNDLHLAEAQLRLFEFYRGTFEIVLITLFVALILILLAQLAVTTLSFCLARRSFNQKKNPRHSDVL